PAARRRAEARGYAPPRVTEDRHGSAGAARASRGGGGPSRGPPPPRMSEISPQDLKARLDRNEPPLLLDVRQDWETRLCRLPNAVHIPIEEIELRVEELNAGDDIVVYCHQGVRSAAVAEYLRSLGFTGVRNLSGGLDLWARTVDPGMRRY